MCYKLHQNTPQMTGMDCHAPRATQFPAGRGLLLRHSDPALPLFNRNMQVDGWDLSPGRCFFTVKFLHLFLFPFLLFVQFFIVLIQYIICVSFFCCSSYYLPLIYHVFLYFIYLCCLQLSVCNFC